MKLISLLGYAFWLSLLYWISGCTELSPEATNNKPVVEAFLIPNMPFTVKITTDKPYTKDDSTKAMPITNLNVKITDSQGKVIGLNYTKDGNYVSAATAKVGQAGSVYQLSFTYNGQSINAQTIIPGKPTGFTIDKSEIVIAQTDLTNNNNGGIFGVGNGSGIGGLGNEAVQLKWTNPNNLYHFFSTQNTTSNPESVTKLPPNIIAIDDFAGAYKAPPQKGTKANLYTSDFKTFGRYAVVLFRVGSEYANLFNNDNSSSQNITTPPTNVRNGLGVFTGINSDTLYLNVKKK
jgi:hypothetical protein